MQGTPVDKVVFRRTHRPFGSFPGSSEKGFGTPQLARRPFGRTTVTGAPARILLFHDHRKRGEGLGTATRTETREDSRVLRCPIISSATHQSGPVPPLTRNSPESPSSSVLRWNPPRFAERKKCGTVQEKADG